MVWYRWKWWVFAWSLNGETRVIDTHEWRRICGHLMVRCSPTATWYGKVLGVEWFLWDKTPQTVRDALMASGHFDDMAIGKPAVVLLVTPSRDSSGWHEMVPHALLTALERSYDRDAVIYDVDHKTARVWFDVVGITL